MLNEHGLTTSSSDALTRDREESGGKGFNELLLVNVVGKLWEGVR